MNKLEIDTRETEPNLPSIVALASDRITCRRRCYRPHAFTWTVLVIVGSALAYGQFLHVNGHGKTPPPAYSVGWPEEYAVKWAHPGPLDRLNLDNLAVDVGWWLAMIAPPLFLSERIARSQFRYSLQILLVSVATTCIMLASPDWLHPFSIVTYDPARSIFELALLVVQFCWLQVLAMAVIGSLAAVWSHSSSVLARVASYLAVALPTLGIIVWCYSSGFLTTENGLSGAFYIALFVATVLTLFLGTVVWLSSAVRARSGFTDPG